MRISLRAVSAGVAVAAALALVTACGSSTPAASSDAAATSQSSSGSSTITIANFAFGSRLAVAPGATVTVVNNDSVTHNVTASDGSFKTADLAKGASATFTAPQCAGSYAFTCTIHPQMKGTLVVSASGATGGASAPAGNPVSPQTTDDHGGDGGGHGSDDSGGSGNSGY